MQAPITIERNHDGSYTAFCLVIDHLGECLIHRQFFGYRKEEIPRLFRQWLQNNNHTRATI